MTDTAVLWGRAESAIRHGWYEDALTHLRKLIEVVDRIDFEYEEWLRAHIDCLRHTQRLDEVVVCQAYLGNMPLPSNEVMRNAAHKARIGDRQALTNLKLWGVALSRAGQHAIAAACFEAAAMPVHQAIEFERAGQDDAAAVLWQRIVNSTLFEENAYESALARINLGLCLHRIGDQGARAALADAMRAVEEVADDTESDGLRERAFDCYQILARIGLETETFENVAEGYLNSIRILRDDGLKLDALRLYEALIAHARRAKEHHAVASTLREAAEFCTRVGLSYGDDLRWRCGEAWMVAAEQARLAEMPTQIVENAYLAAAEAFVAVRAFRQVSLVYHALSALPVKGRERYARLLARLGPRPEDPPRPIPVPEYIKRLPDYEEVWYVDLTEWELDGDPALVAMGIMSDRRFPDYVRRHALLLVLELVHVGRHPDMLEMVRRLEAIRAYPVLDVLELLFRRGDVAVQRAVCSVLGSFRFKRTFALIVQALASDDGQVRSEAAVALGKLYFPHAFDRLRFIYEKRDWPAPDMTRNAALKAIGKINSPESVEFLCTTLTSANPTIVEVALVGLSELTNPDLVHVLRQQVDLVPGTMRASIEDTIVRLAPRTR